VVSEGLGTRAIYLRKHAEPLGFWRPLSGLKLRGGREKILSNFTTSTFRVGEKSC
jgi:hypothetical protein